MKHKTLSDTACYKFLNTNELINKTIGKILKEGKILTMSAMDEQLAVINRGFHFPLKPEVLDAISKGLIRFVTCRNAMLPTALPFFILQSESRSVVAFIAMDNYGSYIEEDDRLAMDVKKFYTLAESSLVALKLLPKTHIGLKVPVIRDGAVIYSAIFTRILNKAYALNTNKMKLDNTLFISACFYLINVLGMKADDSSVLNYAKAVCKNPNAIVLEDFYRRFTEGCDRCPFSSIDSFIQRLAIVEPVFKTLTVRGYLEQYINTYGPSMVLGLEMLEYFAMNVISAIHGSFINNQYVLESVMSNNGTKFYSAIIES